MPILTDRLRTYSELIKLPTFEERFEYLRLDGVVGQDTFGYDRFLNQQFYHSQEWQRIRDFVIVRDDGCDLGMEGYTIRGSIYIHHMNPIDQQDVLNHNAFLIDPDFLICTSRSTHDAIHYGDASLLPRDPIERRPYDTCPWRA